MRPLVALCALKSGVRRGVRGGWPRSSSWLLSGISSSSSPRSPSRLFSTSSSEEEETEDVITWFYNDVYEFPMPEGHRFPMEKYRLVRRRLERDPTLRGNGTRFVVSPLAEFQDLEATHCADYVRRFCAGELTALENRRIGFPHNEAGVRRALSSTGGTIAAATTVGDALRRKRAMKRDDKDPVISGHIAGGTHHAFHDRGEGFCVFSDIACAANVLRRDYGDVVGRILVVDLDVHQGNGNAAILRGVDGVSTFSMHCDANYFSAKERSDCDVEVPAGSTDEAYLRLWRAYLPMLRHGKPDVVFFQAGVDVSQHDRLGKLNVSLEGLRKRNELFYDTFLRAGASIVVTMGGGYPRDLDPTSEAFKTIVDAHSDCYLQANEALAAFRKKKKKKKTKTKTTTTTTTKMVDGGDKSE